MLIRAEEAIQKANRIVRQCGTRNADRIARELGLIVMSRDFSRQKGAYMVIERNRYIFINKHLDPVMHDIVLLHEIGMTASTVKMQSVPADCRNSISLT